MRMLVIKALVLWILFSLSSRCFLSLGIGGKIYDGETANRVSECPGTELKGEAASESMVPAVDLLALPARTKTGLLILYYTLTITICLMRAGIRLHSFKQRRLVGTYFIKLSTMVTFSAESPGIVTR